MDDAVSDGLRARLSRRVGGRVTDGATALLAGLGYDLGHGPTVLRVRAPLGPVERRRLVRSLVGLEGRSVRSPSWLTLSSFAGSLADPAGPSLVVAIDGVAGDDLLELIGLLEELGWSALVVCPPEAPATQVWQHLSAGLVPAVDCSGRPAQAAVAAFVRRSGLREVPIVVPPSATRGELATWVDAGGGLVVRDEVGVGSRSAGGALRWLDWTPESADFVEHLAVRDPVAALASHGRARAPAWLRPVLAR